MVENKIVTLAIHVVFDIEFIVKEVVLLKDGMLLDCDTTGNLLKCILDMVYKVKIKKNIYNIFRINTVF